MGSVQSNNVQRYDSDKQCLVAIGANRKCD